MNTSSRLSWIALGAMLAVSGASAQTLSHEQTAPDAQNSAPMEVTTDTRDYCRHLRQQLEMSRDPPEDVRVLTVEGWKMCSEGHVIAGLIRLRRAVMILRDEVGGR